MLVVGEGEMANIRTYKTSHLLLYPQAHVINHYTDSPNYFSKKCAHRYTLGPFSNEHNVTWPLRSGSV